ncbi:MAG: hypothetical protein RMY16_07330 [Nostoc sp. DedQUE12b]|nr:MULTISPECIES: hypothetical protein [unclassified Nostoc]MDZ7954023.1 hypothetical protein [Nostoc sp. DedQUE09]MDZ8085392.1 hypothetical protein [Nostoc sp. DedQUE12b]
MSIVLASFKQKRSQPLSKYRSIQAQTKKPQSSKICVNETGSEHFGVEKM